MQWKWIQSAVGLLERSASSCGFSLDLQMLLGCLAKSTAALHLDTHPTCSKTDRQADRLCHPFLSHYLDDWGVNCSRIEATAHSGSHPRF